MRTGRTYDLWYYREKGVTLVFYGDRLVYWHWGADPPNAEDVEN